MKKTQDKYRMDSHKLLWHLDTVRKWYDGERIAPLHIDLGITTGCNLACTYCYGVLQGRAGYGSNAGKRFRGIRKEIKGGDLEFWQVTDNILFSF